MARDLATEVNLKTNPYLFQYARHDSLCIDKTCIGLMRENHYFTVKKDTIISELTVLSELYSVHTEINYLLGTGSPWNHLLSFSVSSENSNNVK
jgi:hypothetical protein